jgi:hypothetical protein
MNLLKNTTPIWFLKCMCHTFKCTCMAKVRLDIICSWSANMVLNLNFTIQLIKLTFYHDRYTKTTIQNKHIIFNALTWMANHSLLLWSCFTNLCDKDYAFLLEGGHHGENNIVKVVHGYMGSTHSLVCCPNGISWRLNCVGIYGYLVYLLYYIKNNMW